MGHMGYNDGIYWDIWWGFHMINGYLNGYMIWNIWDQITIFLDKSVIRIPDTQKALPWSKVYQTRTIQSQAFRFQYTMEDTMEYWVLMDMSLEKIALGILLCQEFNIPHVDLLVWRMYLPQHACWRGRKRSESRGPQPGGTRWKPPFPMDSMLFFIWVQSCEAYQLGSSISDHQTIADSMIRKLGPFGRFWQSPPRSTHRLDICNWNHHPVTLASGKLT